MLNLIDKAEKTEKSAYFWAENTCENFAYAQKSIDKAAVYM